MIPDYNKLSKDEIDELIFKYSTGEMNDDEHSEFEQYVYQSEYCYKQVIDNYKVIRILKRMFTHEKLITAYEANEWGQVIELGMELDKLGAPEEVFPKDEKLRIALENLKSNDKESSIKNYLPENFKLQFKNRELKDLSYRFFENGVELQGLILGPGIIQAVYENTKLKIRLTEKHVFLRQKEPQFAIPFEQIKPTVDKIKGELNIKIYPGRTKARVVLTISK